MSDAVEPISDEALASLRADMVDPFFRNDTMAPAYRTEVEGLLARLDRAEAALATAAAAGFARGVEAGAAEADAYAAVNLQMAGDTILHDPVLSGRDRSERGFERSAEMQVDGTIHSAAYHAATNIAGRIRALVPS